MVQPPQSKPSTDELWGRAYKVLVLWSIKRFRVSMQDAEDLVQEGMKQFIGAGGTADAGFKALLQAVGSRINGEHNNQSRNKASNAVRLTADGQLPDDRVGDHAEDRVVAVNWSRKAVGVLLDRVGGDDVLLAMVTHMADGTDAPAELAVALGVGPGDVYNARRRLNGHVTAVKASMEES